MKGLYPTTYDTLTDVILNGNWANYAGKIATLGLVSGTDPEANYVQIPMDTTQWGEGFTQDDYKALVADSLHSFLKLASVFCAGDNRAEVKYDDALVEQSS